MAKVKLKTDKFTTKKKYRTIRAALSRADHIWLRFGFDVSLQKCDGSWVATVVGVG